ncbi:MAG: flagellar biosynthesis protein [Gammaproteobacteria bacterium]|jgi:hypothetical protein
MNVLMGNLARRTSGVLGALALLFALAALNGCATGRDVVSMQAEEGANPATGPAVKIVSVQDQREFQANPSHPSTPSLMNPDDIRNPAITARAFARKRGGYGKALGDVLLPEGQTVAQLTQQAITRAFRDAGYRVLGPNDPGYGAAAPINARISRFWAWFQPGFWAVKVHFQSLVNIQGPVRGFTDGADVAGNSENSYQFVTSSDWADTVQKGLKDLEQNIKTRLGRP